MATREHYANARKPEGGYGRDLLGAMNAGTHARLAAWALPQIAIAADAHVLDIGCGGGANLARLAALAPQGHVTGIDHSPVSVETSRATNAEAIAVGTCDVQEGDVAALPFDDASFDVITAFETVYFWPDLAASFAEVRRVLAADGTFAIVNEAAGFATADERWGDVEAASDLLTVYSADELCAILAQVGFGNVQPTVDPDTNWLLILARRA